MFETGAEWEENKLKEEKKRHDFCWYWYGQKVRVEMKLPKKVHHEYCQLHRDLRSQFVFHRAPKGIICGRGKWLFLQQKGII